MRNKKGLMVVMASIGLLMGLAIVIASHYYSEQVYVSIGEGHHDLIQTLGIVQNQLQFFEDAALVSFDASVLLLGEYGGFYSDNLINGYILKDQVESLTESSDIISDGETLIFSGNTQYRNIDETTFGGTVIIAELPVLIMSNPDGTLSGPGFSGTITYATGAWQLTFDSAPDPYTYFTFSYTFDPLYLSTEPKHLNPHIWDVIYCDKTLSQEYIVWEAECIPSLTDTISNFDYLLVYNFANIVDNYPMKSIYDSDSGAMSEYFFEYTIDSTVLTEITFIGVPYLNQEYSPLLDENDEWDGISLQSQSYISKAIIYGKNYALAFYPYFHVQKTNIGIFDVINKTIKNANSLSDPSLCSPENLCGFVEGTAIVIEPSGNFVKFKVPLGYEDKNYNLKFALRIPPPT